MDLEMPALNEVRHEGLVRGDGERVARGAAHLSAADGPPGEDITWRFHRHHRGVTAARVVAAAACRAADGGARAGAHCKGRSDGEIRDQRPVRRGREGITRRGADCGTAIGPIRERIARIRACDNGDTVAVVPKAAAAGRAASHRHRAGGDVPLRLVREIGDERVVHVDGEGVAGRGG